MKTSDKLPQECIDEIRKEIADLNKNGYWDVENVIAYLKWVIGD